MTDETRAQRNAPAQTSAALPGLGLHHDFASSVVENADADVIVGEALFELLGNLREHFVGIQSGDGVARNNIEQREVARLGALFLEESRVFDGDTGFAGQHAQQFQVAFVKGALVIGENRHGPDGAVVGHQRNAAETPARANGIDAKFLGFFHVIVANQDRLPRADDVFGYVVAGRAGALRHARAIDHFQIKGHLVTGGIERGDIKIFDIKEPAQFFPYFAKQIFLVERGAESAADFVEHVQLFGAARSLLNEVAVFDGHADLVAQSQQQSELGRGEAATIGGAQEQNAEGTLFRLETDGHDTAEALGQSNLAKAANGRFFVESGK